MANDLRSQIFESMNLKDTDELLDIWQSNNQSEWTNTALEVVKEILVKRLGELPPQDDPAYAEDNEKDENEEVTEEIPIDELGLEGWEVNLLEAENQPDYYDTSYAIELIRKINKAAKWVLVINVLTGIFMFPTTKQLMAGFFPENPNIPSIILGFLAIAFGTALNILFTYFPLKALAYILRILIEMEFNSRK